MADLKRFNCFTKPRKKEKALSTSKEVWVYTRVSSKNQKDNYSLEYQKEENQKYADDNGYTITNYFGNEYESASSDITRKEFQELITAIKKAKKKPFGILVYVISRFSRTGGSAINIAYYLVESLGVHLIEVNSGLDTTTDEGKLNIYSKLIEAKRENNQRLKHTIPGMRKFVQSGQYLGMVPIGYDHRGPRVIDLSRRSISQEITINETGLLLRQAWSWKLMGMNDVEILKKLDTYGVRMTKQKISAMWRKPFYCGILTNALLNGSPVKGRWEPLISQEEFLRVNQILDGNHHGYQIESNNEIRPLVGTLLCPKCGKKLTGYEVKKKRLHYYKCQTCTGVSINAISSLKMKSTGANDLFIELLKSYRIDEKFILPFKLQLQKTFQNKNAETFEERQILEGNLKELELELDNLDERFAFGKFTDEAQYNKFRLKRIAEIDKVREKLQGSESEISNLDYFIEKSVEISQNIHNHWQLGSLDVRRKIQKLVFPEGIVINTKEREYLTSKVNYLFLVKSQFIRSSEDVNKKLPIKNDEESFVVAGAGFEPTTFGL